MPVCATSRLTSALRDHAVNPAAAGEHAVGDQAHQPEPAAAIDEVDPAPDHRRRRGARRVGEHGLRAGAEPQ